MNIGIRDKLPYKYALFGKGVCQVHVAELDQKRMLLYSPSKNSHISLRDCSSNSQVIVES